MTEYLVRWEVKVQAESPEEAVILARQIQYDMDSTADEFEVVVDGKGQFHSLSSIKRCYQCYKHTSYLFPDGRCGNCTHVTPEELTGVQN
jgi:hypothetical protein